MTSIKRYLARTSAAMGFVGALALGAAGPASADDTLNFTDSVTKTLDMHMRSARPEQIIMLNVYDTLYRYIDNPPELVPWLAKEHSVSDDHLTWDFTLREGIKFHDGSEMTADDVVYSFKRLLTVGKQPAGAFRRVLKAENVSKVDKYTTRFKLEEPYAPFLAAIPLVAIMNKDVVQAHEKDGDWGAEWLINNTAGSGPYKVKEGSFRQANQIEFVRNPDHFYGWDDNPNPIDHVRQAFINESATRVLALEKGDMHMGGIELPPDQLARLEKAGKNVVRSENMRLFLIPINTTKAPFDNVNFRRCISYAFNYPAFIHEAMQDKIVRNPAPIPNNLWGFPEGYKGITYDMEKAKAECDKAEAAGVDIGQEITIKVLGHRQQAVLAGQIWQADLRRIGVNLKIVPESWVALTNAAAKPETAEGLWTHWVSTYFVDPENWIGQMYDTSYHGTWKASAYYDNPKVDDLLQRAREEFDREKRAELYAEAAKIVSEDAPAVFISNELAIRPMDPRLKGYKFSPVGTGADFRWMYWEEA